MKLPSIDLSGRVALVMLMTKVLALELAPYNITCNVISPGYIATEMTGSWVNDKERYQWMMNMTPMKRLGTTEDLAGPVVFLCSDWCQFVTGINLPVDGGWIAH